MMREAQRKYYRKKLLELRVRLTDEIRAAIHTVAEKAGPTDELSHVPTHAADRDSEGLDRDIALEANRSLLDYPARSGSHYRSRWGRTLGGEQVPATLRPW
jgi:hypothetical protein